MMHAFEPKAPTVAVSATTTSATAGGGSTVWRDSRQLQIANLGPDTVFVAWGVVTRLPSGTLTATTTDYPVLPGATVVVTKGLADIAAVRTATTTATVYFTPGAGL